MMDPEVIKTFEVIRYRKRQVARYTGDKSSNICPRCGHHSYYCASGGRVRRKECSMCNFDSSYNEYSGSIKTALRRGNLSFAVDQALYDSVVEYQRNLIPLKELPSQ